MQKPEIGYYEVLNWETFQHYKHRNPPWIKLHNSILDDYEFTCLQDASKLLLINLWLLASRTNNHIPADPRWIAQKTGLSPKTCSAENIKSLIDNEFVALASNPLAESLQDASEVLIQSKEEESRVEGAHVRTRAFIPPDIQEVKQYMGTLGLNGPEPGKFLDFYACKGWMVGKNKMRDWKAAARNWKRGRDKENHTGNSQSQGVEL